MKVWYAIKELTVSPVPMKQACFDEMRPWAIGRFFVRAIMESASASLT